MSNIEHPLPSDRNPSQSGSPTRRPSTFGAAISAVGAKLRGVSAGRDRERPGERGYDAETESLASTVVEGVTNANDRSLSRNRHSSGRGGAGNFHANAAAAPPVPAFSAPAAEAQQDHSDRRISDSDTLAVSIRHRAAIGLDLGDGFGQRKALNRTGAVFGCESRISDALLWPGRYRRAGVNDRKSYTHVSRFFVLRYD
ncbi:hypothetical protein MKEN_00972700 [Mycena kentingensis (nom. inval.)]|nr:hypothetical protein MKEN_00972700 [Mycena kentingensis (nom. inval.)]